MGRGSYCKNAKKSGVGARVGVWSGGGPGGGVRSGWSRGGGSVGVVQGGFGRGGPGGGFGRGGVRLGVRVVVNKEFKLL